MTRLDRFGTRLEGFTRRRFLGGTGAALMVGLPALDVLTERKARAQAAAPRQRLMCIASGSGFRMDEFTPKTTGLDYDLPRILQSFAPIKSKVAIFTGTFINNPFLTLVPIIIASYAIGAFILGRPLRIPAAGVELLRHPHLLTGAYYQKLFRESWDIVWPFAIGGMTLSVVCSLIAYPVTSSLLRARQRSRAAK